MIVPEYLKPGDTIGVCAPSHGIDNEQDRERFLRGAEKLKKRGYQVVFTDHVFTDSDPFGRPADAHIRAEELNSLIADPAIKAIYSASGGDFLEEILPYIDGEALKKHPKWIQGYSDNTSMLLYGAAKLDVATAYGANFGDFGMEPWQLCVERGLQVLEGTCKEQTSFETYQNGFGKRETGLEGYASDGQVNWKVLNHTEASVSGRFIGGCMDVVLTIAGTAYDGLLDFTERYKEDGILWYLESFDLGFEQMMGGLWKMKELGLFRHASGILFGRPLFYRAEGFDGTPLPTYEDVIRERLADLNIPILMDTDIGHKGPQFVMLNGALGRVEAKDGKGRVRFTGF